ncbi:hypothetical protein AB0C07_24545 [Actinoplanes missouriensis]|uniref:hypothetical protein n=1 Tax=Actinoplanes missouriensis TaxID=1866 RepID=UPI0033CA5F54
MIYLGMAVYQMQLAYSADQWGALGDMLGGVGSILAVIAAASLLGVEIRGRRIEAARYAEERRTQAAEARDREVRQRDADSWRARMIIAEIGESEVNPDDPETERLFINVSNESDAFVFDVIVRIPNHPQRYVLHYIRPGKSEIAEFRGVSPGYYSEQVSCGGPFTPYQLRVVLEFTDPSGRRWRREGWDQPRRLPDLLSNPALYRALPPFSFGESDYDVLLAENNLVIDEDAISWKDRRRALRQTSE